MWVVPPALVDTILKHYNETFALPHVSDGAKATVIGKIRTDGMYIVKYKGQELVRAKAHDVTKGILYDRPYTSKPLMHDEQQTAIPDAGDLNDVLLKMLSHENIASRSPIYECYDKQVQGRTVIEAGSADAGVMAPFNEEKYPEEIRAVGVALSLDHNPRYNKIDAYWGAVNAVVESVRNVTAVGATPLSLSDCLCFGNPEQPEQMGEFVDAVRGITDACRAISLRVYPDSTLPIISGNVSLYNESHQGAIPPSPMIACLGSLPDVTKVLTFDLKQAGSMLVMVGERKDECGGSVFYQLYEALGTDVPMPDLAHLSNEIHAVYDAIQAGLVLSAHDIADGGIAVALAEMSFKNEIGVKVRIPGELPVEKILFTETGGFVLEVARDKLASLEKIFADYAVPVFMIGETMLASRLQMNEVIDLSIEQAKAAWENGLRERLL
jgi:phosphoribosylformylglycinamidine synthase